jgi:hypothetical protein
LGATPEVLGACLPGLRSSSVHARKVSRLIWQSVLVMQAAASVGAQHACAVRHSLLGCPFEGPGRRVVASLVHCILSNCLCVCACMLPCIAQQ